MRIAYAKAGQNPTRRSFAFAGTTCGFIAGLLIALPLEICAQTTAPTPGASAANVDGGLPHWTHDAGTLRLHMIGNSHIDAVWLWPLSEANAVAHSTFRSALDRMREDPELTMTTSSSQFYEWVEASDPAMIAEIRKHVESGRWDLVGGWWVEPDVNIPSGEALLRQGLYGQQTTQRLFGKQATVGYNPDSFGHNGNMPQLLKLQGMSYYVFMRPNALEQPMIRQNLFEWQGIDGTRALTFRIPLFYDDPGAVRNHMERESLALAGQPERTAMEFFGIGDHGGGPTRENMRSIRQIQTEPGAPHIFYSTPDRFFAEVSRNLPRDIQVWTDDLQHHSVGTYTAGSEIKKLNRKTEAALETAEKFAALGTIGWGGTYPKQDLTSAWKRLLLLQFHDSMAATTLPQHSVTARDAFGRAADVAHEALYTSLQRLAWQVPTVDPDSKYLVVFNPHAWPSRMHVEYDLGWEPGTRTAVEDDSGKPVPFQFVAPTTVVEHRQGLVAEVEVPAMGYRQIRIRKVAEEQAPSEPTAQADSAGMRNGRLQVTFESDGTIALRDLLNGCDVFGAGGGMRAVVLDDKSDTWSHHVVSYDKEVGQFQRTGPLEVLENGPLRARVRERLRYGTSTLSIDWVLYAKSRTLEAQVELDWHEHLKMLKFSYPVAVDAPHTTYEIAYGALARKNIGEEDPGQRWIDVSGSRCSHSGSASQTGEYGLSILNDAKYGYSVKAGDARVSIARAAVFANHEPAELKPGVDYRWMDQGLQTFRMQLIPHAGSWQDAGIVRAAEELVAETPVLYQGIHGGTRAGSGSFLAVDAPDLVVEAVKQAEEGADLIVRAYETTGRPAKATLRVNLYSPPATWTGTFRPFEIKTLRIDRNSGAIREVNALEQ